MQHTPAFVSLCEQARKEVREASVREVVDYWLRQPGSVLIDVREDHEWSQGRAVGAVHIGRGIIERDIEARFPDKDSLLVLYCGGGYRSALATKNLQMMGYNNLVSMAGGYKAWVGAGLVTEE